MTLSFPLALPYYAPADELPAAIPSAAEILASKDIISQQRGSRFVARVGPHYAVKYGTDIDINEGQNMLFVQTSCKLRIPKVYAMFVDDASGVKFIVMEHIPGTSLSSLWPQLSENSKIRITEQLRQGLELLRQIPNQGYYGRIGGRGYWDAFFNTFHGESEPDRCGPFATETQFNLGLIQSVAAGGRYESYADFVRRVFLPIYHGHPPVLTHGDLQRKNIIITESGEPVIIDWESAGWYPTYWEYITAMLCCMPFQDEWHGWVPRFLTEYPQELPWLLIIYRNIFC